MAGAGRAAGAGSKVRCAIVDSLGRDEVCRGVRVNLTARIYLTTRTAGTGPGVFDRPASARGRGGVHDGGGGGPADEDQVPALGGGADGAYVRRRGPGVYGSIAD